MFEFVKQILNTYTISFAIAIVFFYFLYEAYKMRKIYNIFIKANESEDPLELLSDTKLAGLKAAYEKTITIDTPQGKKTNLPASEIFSSLTTTKIFSINVHSLNTAAGALVGIGLFGTFWGLTVGIAGFDSSNTDHIQESIQSLLGGMATAFITSLVGMTTSLIYTPCEKYFSMRLHRHLEIFTDQLDAKYYIDDVALSALNQEKLLTSLKEDFKAMVLAQIQSVNSHLVYKKEDGETATIGNAVREILKENSEQSVALKSFSTDLAIELNNGFDEVLSRQMQEKILPLMENVDTTTKAIVEHIDSMASLVSSPATDIIENMVTELKSSMSEIIAEFNKNLSGSATSELENLAIQLGSASQAMADFPKTMATISSTLQITIDEVKRAVAEISNTSANANTTAMQKMQEQITFATGAISSAISEVKDVMSSLSHTSQEQSNEMISKLSVAADKMGNFLNSTVTNLSASVQTTINDLTTDMNSKQADLIALQEDTTSETRKLLETFNQGLERLEKMNEYISGTMNMFQQAQGHITGSTAHLQTITGDMKLATELFNKSQTDYNSKMEVLQGKNMQGIDEAVKLLSKAGEMSEDYVEKFNVIKEGIGNIFTSIQLGLNEYSKTVQATTQKYLDQYSTSLTSTTDALSSTIERQSEVAEMFVEALNKNKR